MATEDAARNSVSTLHKDDVVQPSGARAALKHEEPSKMTDGEIPPKKRKTRRGKCKRRNVHPYKNDLKNNQKVIKPEAPYNSNRFLIEDHGNIDEIDEELQKNDQISTSTVTRTRDSSFSIESEGDFYSTPDDEEEFLIKDFDDQYESVQAERLHAMTKTELIEEYLQLETRVEALTKKLRMKNANLDGSCDENNGINQQREDYEKEIERLRAENELLKRENESLKNYPKPASVSCSSDSADSETDSSDSCSSTSSSNASRLSLTDCPPTNGHSPTVIEEAI